MAGILIVLYLSFSVTIVFAAFNESLLTDELRELWALHQKKCPDQSGADLELVKKTNQGEFPDDRNLKCYTKCILIGFAAMNDEGELTYEGMEPVLTEALKPPMKRMFDSCTDLAKEKSDLCERAYEFSKCCYGVDKEHYYLI